MVGKKILVTGAAGFIGFHLANYLLKMDYSIIGIDSLNDYYDTNLKKDRLSQLLSHNNFKFYQLHLEDRTKLMELFSDERPQIVINLAAQAGVRYSIDHPQSYIASNLVGFANILEACRHFPVDHLIYASSSSVYGANKKTPYSTKDPVDHPVSLYAATKKANELMAHTYSHLYQIPTTGLRFFTVYGPWGRPDMAYYSFTKKIIEGEKIQLFNYGNMKRDFTYIDDIVVGIARLIHHLPKQSPSNAPYKVYNIGNNQPVPLMDFVHTLERLIGKKAVTEYLPMQAGDVKETYAEISDLKDDIGFSPNTPIEVGLSHFVKWYKEYHSQ